MVDGQIVVLQGEFWDFLHAVDAVVRGRMDGQDGVLDDAQRHRRAAQIEHRPHSHLCHSSGLERLGVYVKCRGQAVLLRLVHERVQAGEFTLTQDKRLLAGLREEWQHDFALLVGGIRLAREPHRGVGHMLSLFIEHHDLLTGRARAAHEL